MKKGRADPDERATRRGWLGLGALLAFALALLIAGWDRGPDVLVDYGRELYVPWRLVEGDRLHADIAWFNGPLGPWACALWMRVFGVSLDALQALDALVLLVTLALVFVLLRDVAGGLAAWTGGLAFLGIFGVSQQEAIGNYLFLAPYSHGMTFGFALGLAALVALSRPKARSGFTLPALGGVALGLAFLTKAEVFLAAAAGAAALLATFGGHASTRARRASAVVVGFALPLVAAYVRLALELGAEAAPRALAGTWPHVLDGRANELPFYRAMRGTDDPARRLARVATYALATALFLAATYGAARLASIRGGGKAAFAVGVLTTVGVLAFVDSKWLFVALPVFLAVLLGRLLWARSWKRSGAEGWAASLALGLAVFAAAMLPKVLLVPLARQYGFVLVLPGSMLFVAALVAWIPARIAAACRLSPRAAQGLRAAGVAIVLVVTAAHVYTTSQRFLAKSHAFGEGPDRLWTDGWRGTVLSAIAADLDARLQPSDTLLVLPEGVLLNYALRRRSPSPVVNFMPPELLFFEEHEIVERLEEEPPAAVVLVHRPTDVYGMPFFGDGYGEAILDWVLERYRPALSVGDDPLSPGLFGAVVLTPTDDGSGR